MENKSQSSLMGVVLLLAVLFIGLLSYYFYSRNTGKNLSTNQNESSLVQQSENEPQEAQRGDLEYQEPQTKVEIGTEGVAKGNFEKVEDNNIFFKNDSTVTQYPLTVDEIAVSCTTQDLAGATELDFNLVKEVKIATPATLGEMIPQNEYIVVFAQSVQGVNRVHTIALDSSKCTEQ